MSLREPHRFHLRRIALIFSALTTCAPLPAQFGTAPVPANAPAVVYPPIARAAHVEGEVVVRFSIANDGTTSNVEAISGPPMLRGAVENKVQEWRFKVPLPIGAQDTFNATYTFALHNPEEENAPDDLDEPPRVPCCGDILVDYTHVSARVRSPDGAQSIDVTPAPAPRMPCPDQKGKTPPNGVSADDFVELYRTGCDALSCPLYRVRIGRDGSVLWQGREQVSTIGFAASRIKPEGASDLLDTVLNSTFWSQCSYPTPSPNQDLDADDFRPADYLTVSIGGQIKTVNAYSWVSSVDTGRRVAWAIDKLADTHQWRHGDAATEPYTNMAEDLLMPKPGITALMRSIVQPSATGEHTLEPMKRLLEAGADPNSADESGWTTLMYAVQHGRDPAVQLLIDAHADVNRASLHGDTALMIEAYRGYLGDILLKAGADINAHNANGVTALMLLAQIGNPDELKNAIAEGADVAAQDNLGRTALDYLRAAGCQKPIVPLPQPESQIVRVEKPPCPSTDSVFGEDQAILKLALSKRPAK
jgi:TonB family protein